MKKLKYILVIVGIICLFSCEKFEAEKSSDAFFQVQIDEAVIPVWVKGNTASQKLIVYINGGPGLTSIDVARADMFGWSKSLEKEFAMVFYDQRGCGNAQGNIDEESLTIDQYVKDLDAVITVLKSKYGDASIYLMGHSFGAFIGANYLLDSRLESKIQAWISIDGAYNFDYELSWVYRRTFLENIAQEEIGKGNMIPHWEEALRWVEGNPQILTRQQKNEWRSFLGWPGEIIIPEEIATLSIRQYLSIGFASTYNPFPSYLSSNLKVVNDRLNKDAEGENLINSVKNISIPALFIWGRYDDLIVPEEGEEVFLNYGSDASKKTYSLFPNSSHEPYISDPDRFYSEIRDFVSVY
jgi:pimeloyl-ACP methyl ester carboxylesterase